jgi:hypothetical protein
MIRRCKKSAVSIVCALLSACVTQPADERAQRDSPLSAVSSGGSASMIDDPEALSVAARHPRLAGRTLVALGEARLGNRSVLIVWPVFNSDASTRPASDDTIGVTLELRSDGTLVALDAGWNPRDRTGRAIALQLGSERFERVDRSSGAPLEELPRRISEAFDGFRAACAGGDRAAAVRHARAMAELFSWDVVAYEDVVTEMLWAASTGDYQLAHGSTERIDATRARITAVITYRGSAHTITVIATPKGPSSDRWVITSAAD